jgi:hypothetical protein
MNLIHNQWNVSTMFWLLGVEKINYNIETVSRLQLKENSGKIPFFCLKDWEQNLYVFFLSCILCWNSGGGGHKIQSPPPLRSLPGPLCTPTSALHSPVLNATTRTFLTDGLLISIGSNHLFHVTEDWKFPLNYLLQITNKNYEICLH